MREVDVRGEEGGERERGCEREERRETDFEVVGACGVVLVDEFGEDDEGVSDE